MFSGSLLVARIPEARREVQERLSEAGAGFDKLLAVIEQQQHVLVSKIVAHRCHERAVGLLPYAEAFCHGLWDQVRLSQRRQVDQPHSIGIRRKHLGPRLQRKTGLAATPGAGQRHEALSPK
jgi:hypothetical protein